MSQPLNQNSGPGKDLDKLFRDAIGKQEFTPSPRVWRNLNLKLMIRELMHFNFTNVPRLGLISVSGGLIIVASLTYWALRPEAPSETAMIDKPSAGAIELPVVSKQVTRVVQEQSRAGEVKSLSTPVIKANKTSFSQGSQVKRSPKSSEFIASNSKPGITPALSLQSTSISAREEENTSSMDAIVPVHSIDPLDFSSFNVLPAQDTISFIRSGEVFKYVRETPATPSFFSVSAGIAPEMALYRSNGTTTREYNYWANAGIAYHFSRFSVRTGLGIGYTYDEGIYKVQYRSNDSISYFKEVIGYYPDPANPAKIIYITKDHAIYDSVTHIADDRTRNRYTYVQIPLLLGYTVLETPRFSLGFEAGPALSLLVNEKKAQPVINIPNGRLILLQDNSPSRVTINWQLWVKLSIGYQINKNWGLMINPYYKYYLTSPSQSGESGKRSAQAFGLDIGIQYLFGRKGQKK